MCLLIKVNNYKFTNQVYDSIIPFMSLLKLITGLRTLHVNNNAHWIHNRLIPTNMLNLSFSCTFSIHSGNKEIGNSLIFIGKNVLIMKRKFRPDEY